MPAIEKLIIKGFKAFPGDFELKFEGKHLLMYGENGSGKSSIYYALHCLYQSPLKPDGGKKYFNQLDDQGNPNGQHLLNLHTLSNDACIKMLFQGNSFVYAVGNRGFNTLLLGGGKIPLPGNVDGLFINHKFIFIFFHFHNSEFINLFPVFVKDILPYYYPNKTYCLGNKYEGIIYRVPKNGRRVDKSHIEKIKSFNTEMSTLIGNMNLEISDIYNKFFRENSENELRIKLYYGSADNKVLNGYKLKYDYLLIYRYDNGNRSTYSNSYRSHNEPFIRLDIEELQDDGTYNPIPKPQTYFNEAKLTAIALSIRFSLLDLVSAPDGRFMALDDMLISLDMSNRTKVVDFLLSISDKYKIYLFTHNRAFFELVKEKINIKNDKGNWIYKELYHNDDMTKNPICLDSEDSYTRAMAHFYKCDFPAAANYLRKSVEELMSMMPPYISRKDDGSVAEKLRTKVDATKCLLQRLDGDISDISEIVSALNLLLNPLSHRSIDTDVYRVDLKKMFEIIPRLKAHIKDLDIKEVVAKTNHVFLTVQEDATTKCEIEIELTEAIYSFLNESGVRVLSSAKGNSIQSKTIKDGNDPDIKPHKYNTGTLEETCNTIHQRCLEFNL